MYQDTVRGGTHTHTHLKPDTHRHADLPPPLLLRELQFLADQERISPAAIKKTTLDKVLQQPGVSQGSGVNGKPGLSLRRNAPGPVKKNN